MPRCHSAQDADATQPPTGAAARTEGSAAPEPPGHPGSPGLPTGRELALAEGQAGRGGGGAQQGHIVATGLVDERHSQRGGGLCRPHQAALERHHPSGKKSQKNKNNGTNRGKRFVDRKRGVSEKKGSKQGSSPDGGGGGCRCDCRRCKARPRVHRGDGPTRCSVVCASSSVHFISLSGRPRTGTLQACGAAPAVIRTGRCTWGWTVYRAPEMRAGRAWPGAFARRCRRRGPPYAVGSEHRVQVAKASRPEDVRWAELPRPP